MADPLHQGGKGLQMVEGKKNRKMRILYGGPKGAEKRGVLGGKFKESKLYDRCLSEMEEVHSK